MSAVPLPERPNERRARQRFPVRLLLAVTSGPGNTSQGVSRDASEVGISFLCDREIPVGSLLEFDVHVPPEIREPERIFLRGRGRVVRSEPQSSGRVLIAVATDKYELREGLA